VSQVRHYRKINGAWRHIATDDYYYVPARVSYTRSLQPIYDVWE
jgi:hypothetical protein